MARASHEIVRICPLEEIKLKKLETERYKVNGISYIIIWKRKRSNNNENHNEINFFVTRDAQE
jgi:hypothetical protein